MSQPIPKQEIAPPLTVNAQTGVTFGIAPPNSSAALLPYFSKMKNKNATKVQLLHLLTEQTTSNGSLIGQDPRHYEQVLALFGRDWLEQRFYFSLSGHLVVNSKSLCSAIK